MRITESKVRQIIREEASKIIREASGSREELDSVYGAHPPEDEGHEGTDNDQALFLLAAELDAEVYDATFHPGERVVLANSTTDEFEDGTPYWWRIEQSRMMPVSLPHRFSVVFDKNAGWFYFKIEDVWRGIKQGPSERAPFVLL